MLYWACKRDKGTLDNNKIGGLELMAYTTERTKQIEMVISFFNMKANTRYKFCTEANQSAVNAAIEAADGNVQEVRSYIKSRTEAGEKNLVDVCVDFCNAKMVESKAKAKELHHLRTMMGETVDFYMTQVGIKPPHFVCFCNDSRLFHFSYQRYLENQLRSVFGLEGTPIKMTIRQKGDKEE